nr:MAG TPA: hypothetical protein [Crassvirales sp.]
MSTSYYVTTVTQPTGLDANIPYYIYTFIIYA